MVFAHVSAKELSYWHSPVLGFDGIAQLRNTKLVRVETDAATNEARMVKYGPKVTRNRGAIDSSLVEIGRLQKEVFPSDSDMRDEIAGLKVGETKIFKIRSKEGRREVRGAQGDAQIPCTLRHSIGHSAAPCFLGGSPYRCRAWHGLAVQNDPKESEILGEKKTP